MGLHGIFELCIPKGRVGSKGKLVPDKTLEIGGYDHLFGTGGSQKYFPILRIPMHTVDVKAELVPA